MTTADDVDCRRCNAAGRLLKGWKKAVTAVTVAKRRHTPMTLDAFMVVWFGVGCIDLWLGIRLPLFFFGGIQNL